jgi:hypothetical protein
MLSWGHILVAIGALAGLCALYQASIWRRHAGHGRGTPGYARGRDGRRFAIWSLVVALILLALGGLTALGDTPLY